MSKPVYAALGAFVGSSLGVLGVSYFKHKEFAYSHAFSLGVGMAFGMYIIALWKQQKSTTVAERNDPSVDDGEHLE